jgi:hypothetical protein
VIALIVVCPYDVSCSSANVEANVAKE